MLCVVAMFHVTASELTKSECNLHATCAIRHTANSIHIFPGPFFPFWRCFSTATENKTFFKVNVNRVAPAISTIFDVPDFELALAWSGTQSTWICRQTCTTISFHCPWCAIGSGTSSEGEGTVNRIVNFFLSRLSQWDHLLATNDIVLRIHTQIFAFIARYAELEELANTRIPILPLIAIIDRLIGS